RAQFRARLAAFDKRKNIREGKANALQFLRALLLCFALQLINRLEEFVFGGWISAPAVKEFTPRISTAQPDHKILAREAKGPQCVDEQRNQLRICAGIRFADDIGIELEVFAEAALLLPFVAKELRNRKLFKRLFETAFV